ncbi:hypothetical protein G7Z17_g3567 [Cylindrodendrum hubeiense]|uniref:Uncharacterized protein n=1 Tax=Cylindrodendrum hubeiense TaxID=595255 RepID=A0A9P5HFN7_9HYPO|nr:hypothetical protein G7Z17_g3567 [Cylindrodendrum hubeiense]
MAKRGRPSLNLTPEERLIRRRAQLADSQRKLRASRRQGESRSHINRGQCIPDSSESPSPPTHTPECSLSGDADAVMPRRSPALANPQHPQQIMSLEWEVTMRHDKVADATRRFCDEPSDMAAHTAAMSLLLPASNFLPDALLRTDAHAGQFRIDLPNELLPFPDDLALRGQSYGMDSCDISTNLIPLTDDLAFNDQAYGIDIYDLPTDLFSFTDNTSTSEQSYGTSIYEELTGELFDLCQIDPSLESSTHEPPSVCDDINDYHLLNGWDSKSPRKGLEFLPAATRISSGTTLADHFILALNG